jgi:hypothetical protein
METVVPEIVAEQSSKPWTRSMVVPAGGLMEVPDLMARMDIPLGAIISIVYAMP